MTSKFFITDGNQVLKLEKSFFTKEELRDEDFAARKKPVRHERHLKTGKIVEAGHGEKVFKELTPEVKKVIHKLRLAQNVDKRMSKLQKEIERLDETKKSHFRSVLPIFNKYKTEKIKFKKFLMSVQEKEYKLPQYKPLFTESYKRLTKDMKKEVDKLCNKYQTDVKKLLGYIKIQKSIDSDLDYEINQMQIILENIVDLRRQINDVIIPNEMNKTYAQIKKWNQSRQTYPYIDENVTSYPDMEKARKKPVHHVRHLPSGKIVEAGHGAPKEYYHIPSFDELKIGDTFPNAVNQKVKVTQKNDKFVKLNYFDQYGDLTPEYEFVYRSEFNPIKLPKKIMEPIRAHGPEDARKQMKEKLNDEIIEKFGSYVKQGMSSSDALAQTSKDLKISWDVISGVIGLSENKNEIGLGNTIKSKKTGKEYRVIEKVGEDILAKEGHTGKTFKFKESDVEKI